MPLKQRTADVTAIKNKYWKVQPKTFLNMKNNEGTLTPRDIRAECKMVKRRPQSRHTRARVQKHTDVWISVYGILYLWAEDEIKYLNRWIYILKSLFYIFALAWK